MGIIILLLNCRKGMINHNIHQKLYEIILSKDSILKEK